VETVTTSLAREWTRQGHAVSVMTNRYPRSLPAVEVIDGIRVIRRLYPNLLPSPGRRPAAVVVKQILSIPLSVFELARTWWMVLRARPDAVNVHYLSYPAAYAILAARLARRPVVLSFHGSDVPASPYPAAYGWVARWACKLASVVTCNSEDLASYLRRDVAAKDQGKIVVCPFGVDADGPAVESERNAAPYALVVARLVEKKGVAVAIRAMAEIAREQPTGLTLKIVGSGPLDSALRALTRELGLSHRIEFLGSRPPHEVRTLMSGSLCVLVPSHWEAFGVVALESMIAGKPVVAVARGGITEIVVDGGTGMLVPSGDPSAMASALKRLAADPGLAAALGAAGRERAIAEYAWLQVAERFAQYCEIAAAGRQIPEHASMTK
jgi:glycosyltransferase involved in cell wall biosynthesis